MDLIFLKKLQNIKGKTKLGQWALYNNSQKLKESKLNIDYYKMIVD